jgi:hypothetical protein
MRSQVFSMCRLCALQRRPEAVLPPPRDVSIDALRVCEAHRARARLESGAWLAPLLAAAPGVLDGPGMGFLFNPVRIDTTVAWVSWAFSSWQAYLPLLPCADSFEFEVLHRPEHLETLRSLQESRAMFGAAPTAIDLARWSRPSGWHRFEAVQRLCDQWWRRQCYGEALRAAGRASPVSAQEAMAFTRELEPCVAPIDRIGDALRCLLAMAERRFGTEPPVHAAHGA